MNRGYQGAGASKSETFGLPKFGLELALLLLLLIVPRAAFPQPFDAVASLTQHRNFIARYPQARQEILNHADVHTYAVCGASQTALLALATMGQVRLNPDTLSRTTLHIVIIETMEPALRQQGVWENARGMASRYTQGQVNDPSGNFLIANAKVCQGLMDKLLPKIAQHIKR